MPRTAGVHVRTAVPAAAPAAGMAVASALSGALAWVLARHAYLVGAQWLAWTSGGASPHAVRPEDVLALLASVVGAAAAAWFTLGLTVAAGCAAARNAGSAWLVGERLVARHGPVLVRRALAVSTGTGLALVGATVGATAATSPSPDHLGWAVTSPQATPEPSPRPPAGDATVPPVSPAVPPTVPPTVPPDVPATHATGEARPPGSGGVAVDSAARAVTVRPGDTLWAIARAHLPADATVADVAAAWPAWYAANVAVVGPDPDLIRPGQRLVEPPSTPATGDTATTAPSAGTPPTGADR